MNEKELFEKLTAELNPEYVCEELLPTIRAYVSERVKEAVDAEREACAKVVERYFKKERERFMPNGAYVSGEVCAAEIRAGGVEAKR